MKYAILILFILIAGCHSSSKKSLDRDLESITSKISKENDRIISPGDYVSKQDSLPDQEPTQCNIKILLEVSEKMDSLSIYDIDAFLKTFSKKCRNNVEYSEWSNELLFDIINAYAYQTVRLLNDSSYARDYILKKLSSPLLEKHDPKKIIEKVRETGISGVFTKKIIKSLEVAQLNYYN